MGALRELVSDKEGGERAGGVGIGQMGGGEGDKVGLVWTARPSQ